MRSRINQALGASILLILANGIWAQAPVPSNEIESSIKVLRGIDTNKLSDAQKDEKAKQIDEAWKKLTAAGKVGVERLKKEIAAVNAEKVKDDFFMLNASALLWEINKEVEAQAIADIWKKIPLSAQYNYVFYTGIEAARTKKPEVVPMLKAVLRDDKGNLFFPLHAMHVTWPLTHEFVWGAYGPEGLPILQEIFETSDDTVELVSAMTLLTQAQHLSALPRIRQLTTDKREEVRFRAIKSLGIFGHPDDYDRLITGLGSAKGMEAFFYAFALYEFDDERAVPHLIPHLKAEEEFVKKEVMLALLRLLTPESFTAVKKEVERLPDGELKKFISRSLTLRQDRLPSDFATKSPDEQAALLDKVRNRETSLAPDAKMATNLQLRSALKEWAAKGRIYGSSFAWIGLPQIIAAGTPDDIKGLLEAKSIIYLRLSDECLYETRDIDKAVKYIGRSRYRKGIGVTLKAEPK
jgi:hypothetical protein